jgi:hypothetical protein
MNEYLPMYLPRKKAMVATGMGRKTLEKFVEQNKVRYFTTKGGHKRYNRNDLINQNENL